LDIDFNLVKWGHRATNVVLAVGEFNGKIYYFSADGYLTALDPKDGSILLEKKIYEDITVYLNLEHYPLNWGAQQGNKMVAYSRDGKITIDLEKQKATLTEGDRLFKVDEQKTENGVLYDRSGLITNPKVCYAKDKTSKDSWCFEPRNRVIDFSLSDDGRNIAILSMDGYLYFFERAGS
jgi:outer membrane protein assembly factor BamB